MKKHGVRAEKKCLGAVDHFITVNGSLARYFEEKYGFRHVQVVMNCPETTDISEAFDFRAHFAWEKESHVFLYQGSINAGRGLELLIETFARLDAVYKLVIIGDGPLMPVIKGLIGEPEQQNQIKLIGWVEYRELRKYINGADFGLALLENINLSKAMASPNKLFEYIRSCIPVIVTDTLENRLVLQKYEVGLLTQNNTDDIRSCMIRITGPVKEIYKRNCEKARKEYCWENQVDVLDRVITQ
jgi:glycosyltransferase involved in cell wall biosynthesis